MNVNIYYGGRGLVDDPTIVVINRIQEVLEELNVHVTRYNLYEIKNTITTLSQSVVEADGVVFATTVEWVGAICRHFLTPAGYMQTRAEHHLRICFRWLCQEHMENVKLLQHSAIRGR